MGCGGNFLRSHVYANGALLATYENNVTQFSFSDWLGSKRVVAGPEGGVVGTFANLPFGDELTCSNVSLGGHHFTGKIHDQESFNDYFGARYYSNFGSRFMSPDPGWFIAADPTNPQSWNMYAYALNNPLTNVDPDGFDCVYFNDAGNGVESVDRNSSSGECNNTGGDYVRGTISQGGSGNFAGSDDGSPTFAFNSSDANGTYTTYVNAPGSQDNGTNCSGNCTLANQTPKTVT